MCHTQAGAPGSQWYSSVWGWKPENRWVGACWSMCWSLKAQESGALMSKGRKKNGFPSSRRENEFVFLCLFGLSGTSTNWMGPLTMGEGRSSLLSPLVQISISSVNMLTDIPRTHSVLAICISLNPVKMIPKINHHKDIYCLSHESIFFCCCLYMSYLRNHCQVQGH